MNSWGRSFRKDPNPSQNDGMHRTWTSRNSDVIVRGVLSVTVISAEDLPAMDITGKSDPYVVLCMKKAKSKCKTRVIYKNLNPVWNQTFDFVVEDGLHDLLMLEVWDRDTFGKDFMGRCSIKLSKVISELEYEDSFPLDDSKTGRLNLNLKWASQTICRDIDGKQF